MKDADYLLHKRTNSDNNSHQQVDQHYATYPIAHRSTVRRNRTSRR